MASSIMFVKSCKSFMMIAMSKSILERKCWPQREALYIFSLSYKSKCKHLMNARHFSKSSWSLDVVCSGGDGTSTLLLNTPDNGYLFNCGEMTQRSLLSNRLAHKFNSITNIFLTSMSYSNISGIPGYLLSTRFRDTTDPFNIHGHPNNENVFRLLHLYTAIRINKALNTEWKHPEMKSYADKNINVEYVKLKSVNQLGCNKGEEIYALAYIVKIRRNKFNRSFLVLECPTEEYLDSLLSSHQLQALSSDPKNMPAIVVNMSPAHIIQDLRYKEFMSRFGPHVKHLMMNTNSPCLYLKTQHEVHQVLHRLSADIFPPLQSHLWYNPHPTIPESNIVQAFNGLRFLLDDSPRFSIIEHLFYHQNIDAKLNRVTSKVKQRLNKSEDKLDYPEITFLGTSSGLANILRNPSGILVQTRQDEYILLDCGEGTLSQMYQIYGNQTEKVLSNLKVIFLSHLHFDHYGGLHKVIEARARAIQEPNLGNRLAIIAPKVFLRWISCYERYFDELTSKVRLFAHENLLQNFKDRITDKQVQKMEHCLGFEKILPVPVIHNNEMCHGVVLRHEDGWKMVYSGDCRPTKELINAGKACDILIHESTYPDNLKEKAEKRLHCTLSEAIEVADKMKAKMTILTHISSKNILENKEFLGNTNNSNILFAYDLMKIRRSSVKHFPDIKKSILQAFS